MLKPKNYEEKVKMYLYENYVSWPQEMKIVCVKRNMKEHFF